MLFYFLDLIISFLLRILVLLLIIAFLTLVERKFLASVQRRRGPNVVGWFGLLQPFADGIKLVTKEIIIPSVSNKFLFIMSPVFTFFCSIALWFIVPMDTISLDIPFSIFFVFSISSLSVHGIIFAGWSSNSKYAFLGGIRSASQMISYEISLSTVFLSIMLMCGDCSLITAVKMQQNIWFICPLLPIWFLFVVISLAETNRAPFDLPEAEAELVAGYNVEYSAITFAMFFLAEYGNMLIMSFLSTIFFWGGWNPIFFIPSNISFAIKSVLNVMIFILVRAALPRYRYDQLMKLGWKVLLPLTFSLFLLQSSLMFTFEMYGL